MPPAAGVIAVLLYLFILCALVLGITGIGALVVLIVRHVF
jgi:hypothetical protein